MRDRSLQSIVLRYLGVRLLMVMLVPTIFSAPVIVPLMAQPSLAQAQNSQEEVIRLLE